MARLPEYSRESGQMVGESPALLELLEHASRAAPLSKPVLVIGERGTGKELIAARLHFLSPRWEQPFIKLNCATLTETLLETELFGHEAGAFTGATRRHTGRFEQADGGTLFLDELASVSTRVQEKILRAVEYGEFERVGGSETLTANVRLIGATNADLPSLVETGRFRADLLDRLAFDVLTVPPLRARKIDILPLAEYFALGIIRELGREFFAGFSRPAREALLAYEWPGNVRELKNVVERSVYHSQPPDTPIETIIFDPFVSPFRPPRGKPAEPDDHRPPPPREQPPAFPIDLRRWLDENEKRLLEQALQEAAFNQTTASELVGMSYHQFRGALRKHGLSGRKKPHGTS